MKKPHQNSQDHNIEEAAKLLRAGEIVAFPTETVYGIGGDARNSSAIKKIYQAKGRPSKNPLIIHLANPEQIEAYVQIPSSNRFHTQLNSLLPLWPGPLTIVFPKKAELICDEATAGLSSVGIRVPHHPVASALLREANIPIAAPSANRSNYVSATSAEHVRSCFGAELFVIDGGATPIGIESTIVSLEEDAPVTILRHGAVTSAMLAEALGEAVVDRGAHKEDLQPTAPGQLSSHYSPKTPLHIFDQVSEIPNDDKIGVITFSKNLSPLKTGIELRRLSEDKNLEAAASNLYRTLRELDEAQLHKIYIERPTEQGIGKALRDRIERAEHRTV